MNSKLTLRLKDQSIVKAKNYAHESGISVSKLFEEYIGILDSDKIKEVEYVPPLTRSLKGIVDESKVSESDYKKYLEKKHS